MAEKPTLILTHATVATMVEGYGLILDAAVICAGGRILWAGPMTDIPIDPDAPVIDCQGRLLTPGLIDCHSHVVFAGDRAGEFEMRLEGATYEQVARAGGGILSTVRAT
ncbi:MAG: imidazolonepropionase, partial [Pseudomonadota bacterium]